MGTKIKAVTAQEMFRGGALGRGTASLEVTIVTDDGARGTHMPTGGVSVGKHEMPFVVDGGKRLFGEGMLKAASIINTIIAPKLVGMDVTQQRAIDNMMIELDGTSNKSRLGANTTVAVSIAVIKAAANSCHMPLYRYIGGVDARTIPVPRVAYGIAGVWRDPGETRHLKPSYELAVYGVKNFEESIDAAEIIRRELIEIMKKRHGFLRGQNILSVVKDDRDAMAAITDAIENTGYKGKAGIVIDCAAGCYYEAEKDRYNSLFYAGDKTREDMIELYKNMVTTYPLIALEDPLNEDDFEGHAILTKELGIEIAGDDLFTTNTQRVRKALEIGAANCMVLKIPQVGTVSEALDACKLMQEHGGSINPCASRGDPSDQFAVGINAGQSRAASNTILDIEKELGSSAIWLGREAYKTKPPRKLV